MHILKRAHLRAYCHFNGLVEALKKQILSFEELDIMFLHHWPPGPLIRVSLARKKEEKESYIHCRAGSEFLQAEIHCGVVVCIKPTTLAKCHWLNVAG